MKQGGTTEHRASALVVRSAPLSDRGAERLGTAGAAESFQYRHDLGEAITPMPQHGDDPRIADLLRSVPPVLRDRLTAGCEQSGRLPEPQGRRTDSQL